MLAALGYWGLQTGATPGMKFLLGLGAPLLAALVWGGFVAPKARRRLEDPSRLLVELVIFGLAIGSLFVVAKTELALIFTVLVMTNLVLMYLWRQRGM